MPPAFSPNGWLDLNSTQRYLEYLHEHGAKTVMTTASSSGFSRLTQAEIQTLNIFVAQVFPGDFIAGDYRVPGYPVLLRYPDRYYDDDTVRRWFEARAEQGPTYIHVAPLRDGTTEVGGASRSAPWHGKLLHTLAQHENIIGVKEEVSDSLAMTLIQNTDLHVIVSGGSMQRALSTAAPAWLTGVGSLIPELEAARFAYIAEEKCFDTAALTGWHPFLREALKQLDLLPAHEREPWPVMADDCKRAISTLLKEIS